MKNFILKTLFTLAFSISAFAFQAQATHQLCTDYFANDTSGVLYDSGGPTGNYSDNTLCDFYLSVVCASNITFTFSSFSSEANHDSLVLYDGPDQNSPVLLVVSGNSVPGTITSTSNIVYIVWRSDSAVNDSGFVLNWNATLMNITLPVPAVCIPIATAPFGGIGIYHFELHEHGFPGTGINQSVLVPGYTDYTCDTMSMYVGRTYDLSAQTGFTYVEDCSIWLDMNSDGMFDSIGEKIFSDSAVLSFHNGTIILDATMPLVYNTPLRMRVMSQYSGTGPSFPCTNLTAGTIHDYTINAYPGTTGIENIKNIKSVRLSSNPDNEFYHLKYSLNNSGYTRIEIFDINGRKIKTVSDEWKSPGSYEKQFTINTAGFYLLKLSLNDEVVVRKIIKIYVR